MSREAISLMVHRKDGRLLVTPWALSKTGFQCLDDLFVAEPGEAGLIAALEAAASRAREASELPRDKRFSDDGVPYWQRAGYANEKQFVKGAIAVHVLFNDARTEIAPLAPTPKNDGMSASGRAEIHKAGLPMAEVAARIREILETSS